jgi:dCTP deaminase
MILSNEELFKALDDRRIVITPEPKPRYAKIGSPDDYCPFDTHSVDLKLGVDLSIPEAGAFQFDLMQKVPLAPTIHRNARHVKLNELSEEFPFILKPNQFVLGKTLEKIELPFDHQVNKDTKTCLAARIEGKSSRARVGLLIHFTAPTVHPGFNGTLTLEMINLGAAGIILRPGMPIAQLIVEEVKGIPSPNPSQFQNQTTPSGMQEHPRL